MFQETVNKVYRQAKEIKQSIQNDYRIFWEESLSWGGGLGPDTHGGLQVTKSINEVKTIKSSHLSFQIKLPFLPIFSSFPQNNNHCILLQYARMRRDMKRTLISIIFLLVGE